MGDGTVSPSPLWDMSSDFFSSSTPANEQRTERGDLIRDGVAWHEIKDLLLMMRLCLDVLTLATNNKTD